jgi:hypothetical protein
LNLSRRGKAKAETRDCTGLRVQIVVEGNELNIIEAIFAFGEHRWRVAPDTHLPVPAKFMNSRFETSNSFVVIFQEENRFHPNAPTSAEWGETGAFAGQLQAKAEG